MRLLWVIAPLVLLALFVGGRALLGKPLSRHTTNVVVALFLLVYLIVTGALGVFWVARMDLPAFDLHYLFGYCVLGLAAVHLLFQLRILGTFFRRIAPRWSLTDDGKRFRGATRFGLAALFLGGLAAPLVWLATGPPAASVDAEIQPPAEARASTVPSSAPRVFIEGREGRTGAVHYLHGESSFSRRQVLRRAKAVVVDRPTPFKPYDAAPRVQIPPSAPLAALSFDRVVEARRKHALPGDDPAADHVVVEPARDVAGLQQLATALHYTNGVTSNRGSGAGVWLRAAASSGALHPVDVYVLARRVPGVAPGIYYHHAAENTLVRVAGPEALERVSKASSSGTALADAPVAFAFGVTFDRTTWKYDVRSYRYLLLDTGHALGNFTLATIAVGWRCFLDPYFEDSEVNAALGLEPDGEAVLVLAGCRGKGGTRTLPTTRTDLPAHVPVELPSRADRVELTRLSHQMTSWRLLDGPPTTERAPSQPKASSATQTLPEAKPATRDLFETISSRRSYRDYSARAISTADLASLLADAESRLPPLWPGADPELHVVVRAVDSLEPGVYRYHPPSTLERTRAGDPSTDIRSAGLSQELLGRAAVVLVWGLAASTLEAPPRAFRTAQLRVGLGGQTAYLSAVARGLGVCGVGAFYDDEVNELTGSVAPVYLMGIGHR